MEKKKKCTYTCINLQDQWLACCWSGDAPGLCVHWAVSLEEDSFLHPRWEDTKRGTSRIQEQNTVIFTFLSVPHRANSKMLMPEGVGVNIAWEDTENYWEEQSPCHQALQHQSFIWGKK